MTLEFLSADTEHRALQHVHCQTNTVRRCQTNAVRRCQLHLRLVMEAPEGVARRRCRGLRDGLVCGMCSI